MSFIVSIVAGGAAVAAGVGTAAALAIGVGAGAVYNINRNQQQANRLQEQAQQQKRRIEDWQRKMEAALNTDEQVWSVRVPNYSSAVIGFHVCLSLCFCVC